VAEPSDREISFDAKCLGEQAGEEQFSAYARPNFERALGQIRGVAVRRLRPTNEHVHAKAGHSEVLVAHLVRQVRRYEKDCGNVGVVGDVPIVNVGWDLHESLIGPVKSQVHALMPLGPSLIEAVTGSDEIPAEASRPRLRRD